MPEQQKPESFLAVDAGSVTTKVGLADSVGGEFRFLSAGESATTIESTNPDIIAGVRSAIRQIEARTGRRLLTDDGQLVTPERPDGQGVDALAAVTSAAAPLRVAIVGLSREVSLASAVRAVNSTHAVVAATLALDETGGRWQAVKAPEASSNGDKKVAPTALQDPAVIAAESLAQANADIIVLVGGTDGGATIALNEITNLVVAVIASRDENVRPIVIFAGNSEARPQIANRIGQLTQLRVVDNVRPSLERENPEPLRRELETLYAERKVAWLPGLNALMSWTPAPIIPASRAFENVIRFLARRYNLNVLGADIGASATTVVTARGDTHARIVRANLGIGPSLENAIEAAGIQNVMNWLPAEMVEDEARRYWLNHSLRPRTVPTTRDDARLMYSVARAALATAVAQVDVSGIDLVVLTGGIFANNQNPGALALMALDALQPSGVFTLAVDVLGLAPAFGGLAAVNAEAAANVLERDCLVTLGTVIAPISHNRDGQVDVRVKIQPPDGGAMNLEVEHGSLELVPLAQGQKASIEVRPVSGVSIGLQRRGIFKADIEGGALGLVIDARGRPITLAADAAKRRAQVQQWYWDIGGEVSYGG